MLGILLGFATQRTPASPRVPADDSEVLERLPRVPTLFASRGKAAVARSPDPLSAAIEARRWLELNRAESDPRYLGRAQAVLSPWWHQTEPPIEIRLLRATVRQSLHDFQGAITDLNEVLRVDPSNAQAWLTKSSIHTLRGEWAEACEAVVRLTQLTSRLVSATAAASVLSVRGQETEACGLLRNALKENPTAPGSVRLWALTLLGEVDTWMDRDTEAELHFKQAMELGLRDGDLLASYADFLLGQRRFEQAAKLVEPETRSDNLLLRLALAESNLNPSPPMFQEHVRILGERFAAARARGEAIHQREEARYQLELLHKPARALELARENWGIQKEPADTKILLESALAVQDTATVEQVRDWMKTSRFEDRRILRLLESQRPASR